MGYLRR